MGRRMIHTQTAAWPATPRFYAYCPCGVCMPLRRDRETAEQDDTSHRELCTRSTP